MRKNKFTELQDPKKLGLNIRERTGDRHENAALTMTAVKKRVGL